MGYGDDDHRRRVLTERLKVDWERFDRQQRQYIDRQLLRAQSTESGHLGDDSGESILRLVRPAPRT